MSVLARQGRNFALPSLMGLFAACSASVAPAVRQDHRVPLAIAAEGVKPPVAEGEGIRFRIHAPSSTSPVLRVEVEARGEALDAWSTWRPASLGPLPDLSARDAAGDLPVHQALVDDQLMVTFERPIAEPLTLQYSLTGPDSFDERLHVAQESFVMTLAALLWPRAEQKRRFRIEVLLAEHVGQSVATTLGGGAVHELNALPRQLQDVTLMAGPAMQVVRFDSREGRDDIYALGGPGFDVRWVAAELAVARSRIDESFGGTVSQDFPWLVFARAPRQYVPPLVVQGSGLGARIVVTQSEAWTARTLLPVAQVMVRRWLGGVLRLGGDDAWLTLGVTRYIALRELYAAGMINADEVVRELNVLEAAVTLNALGPLEKMARGALYALRCDGLLSAHSSVRSLGALFAPLVERAEANQAELPLAEFEQRLEQALGDSEVSEFRRMREGTDAITMPRGVPGRCLTETQIVYRRFALGFDPPDPELDGPQPVHGVTPDGPAARAGLRDGDLLHSLRYVPGDPSVDAELDIERDGLRKMLRFQPSDRSKRGRGWKRNAAVRDEDCWLIDPPR